MSFSLQDDATMSYVIGSAEEGTGSWREYLCKACDVIYAHPCNMHGRKILKVSEPFTAIPVFLWRKFPAKLPF